MGTRFLAILAMASLAAGGAFVGFTSASGSWETIGVGLEPGAGYAVQVTDKADRMKLELVEVTEDPLASFSIYTPDGERAGYFKLEGSTRSAEVVVDEGVWLVFVYQVQGADLNIAVHGQSDDAGRFAEAEVERADILLGQVESTKSVDQTYTAVLKEMPVLAGVYLQGSARNLQTELSTERGVVEVVAEEQTAAVAGGVVVESHGSRVTNPAFLEAGPFTAKVQADSLSGRLYLVALYVAAPGWQAFEQEMEEEAEAEDEDQPDRRDHAKAHDKKHRAPKVAPHATSVSFAGPAIEECGTADSGVAYALDVPGGTMLRLQADKDAFSYLRVFTPWDELMVVVPFQPDEEEHEDDEDGDDGAASGGAGSGNGWSTPEEHDEHEHEAEPQEVTLNLFDGGEYVLYVNGASVDVARFGDTECALRELPLEEVVVATADADLLMVGRADSTSEAEFMLAPLEFGLRLSDGMVSGAWQAEAVFTNPDGEHAGMAHMSWGMGGFFGRNAEAKAHIDPTIMPAGLWTVDLRAELVSGTLEAIALHYVRAEAEPEDEEDEDDGDDGSGDAFDLPRGSPSVNLPAKAKGAFAGLPMPGFV